MWAPEDITNSTGQGAGGFLDQTYNRKADSGEPGKSNRVRTNSVVPLMIKHLTDSTPETLNLSGVPINILSLVAYVRKFERVTTKISYELADETGTIIAFQWINDGMKKQPVTVPIGGYARVVGSPREQLGIPHLLILKIRPVNRMAEIFDHLLEVTYIFLKSDANRTDEPESGEAIAPGNGPCRGMNKEQSVVFVAIRAENESNTGIEKSILRMKLPDGIRDNLDDILEFLVCEGHIYTTCTDDHFKTT